MRRSLALAAIAIATALSLASAHAQPKKAAHPAVPASSGPTNLRAHVGTEQATRLLRSADADERIRGIERAAALGSAEGVSIVVDAIERAPHVKADPRALLAAARTLASYTDQERARAGLLVVVNAPNPVRGGPPRAVDSDDVDPAATVELARETAAIALARSAAPRSMESLYAAARTGGVGQAAALHALMIHPPTDPGFFGASGALLSTPILRWLAELGDLRVLELVHAATKANDVSVRATAIVALAELGDLRVVPLARAAIAEPDARLRAAAGEAFVLLGAPERFKATAALLADDATSAIGIRLAERVNDPAITKLLAARASTPSEPELRYAAIRALGRAPDDAAARALVSPAVLEGEEASYQAFVALARSPAPAAGSLLVEQTQAKARPRLALRAYVVRALGRGERMAAADRTIATLAASRVAGDRALGAFARIALGDDEVDAWLDDVDPRVRRAAAMATLARPFPRSERALLDRLRKEPDALTRQVLALGLGGGDRASRTTTSTLVDRAESGGPDGPLAAYALATRASETDARKAGQLLAARDPILRAHVARGLSVASLPDATGRLAEAYGAETDPLVRRAIVGALAARTRDEGAPSRKRTLALAAELDPDGPTRAAARRAQSGVVAPFAPAPFSEVAWLRVAPDDSAARAGVAPSTARPVTREVAGAVVRSDGLAVPIVFDEDGFALVPGVPPGEARLVLAPRLPTYESPKP